ncbi:Crp/Fnr family transcriptional regulator [Natronospira bacteriovora]|uniref:Crp/Fnr family transcriptional regulator n=1 Tax=Natronospira bacteriovora TaxID=3069753 RepID=A0ABU0W8F6_9GAMM|nr:Crp/Fnr family transcriptional regulator [Natronospira sp. AB-CW4]MDQ2070308.1 Crp/Fnr family transcriptional regulator [Natronospira sp. AB-CW4]
MDKKAIRKLIESQRFFADLDSDWLDFLAEHAVSRKVSRDEVIFRHGNKADSFYLVTDGRISLEVAAIEGPPLELQNLGEGAIIGWSWLIPPYQWHFQARALEDANVIRFDGDVIFKRCEEDPDFGYDMLKRFAGLMSERVSSAREKMMQEWNPPGFA